MIQTIIFVFQFYKTLKNTREIKSKQIPINAYAKKDTSYI